MHGLGIEFKTIYVLYAFCCGEINAKYLAKPIPIYRTSLALGFCFVTRGSLFSQEATIEEASPFGFAGLAWLVGLFTEQAALKLREVAEALVSKHLPGFNATPRESEPEKISSGDSIIDDQLLSNNPCREVWICPIPN